jgi:hypothetical protein
MPVNMEIAMAASNRFMPHTAMRLALAFGALVTVGGLDATTPASAQGAWCAQYGGRSGGTNCGFYTYQQCQWAVSGVGGFCSPSPYARYGNGGLDTERQPRRKVRRQYR